MLRDRLFRERKQLAQPWGKATSATWLEDAYLPFWDRQAAPVQLLFHPWTEGRENRKCVCNASYNYEQNPSRTPAFSSVQPTFFGLQLPLPSPLVIELNLVHFQSGTLFSYFISPKQHWIWSGVGWGFPKESRIRDNKNLAMFVSFNPLTALNMRTILFCKTVCLSRAKALWISEVEIRKKQLKWWIQEFELRWATICKYWITMFIFSCNQNYFPDIYLQIYIKNNNLTQ